MKVALMNTKRVITGIDIFLGSCNKTVLIVAIARKIQERIKILWLIMSGNWPDAIV